MGGRANCHLERRVLHEDIYFVKSHSIYLTCKPNAQVATAAGGSEVTRHQQSLMEAVIVNKNGLCYYSSDVTPFVSGPSSRALWP